jgi:hypothetical protein
MEGSAIPMASAVSFCLSRDLGQSRLSLAPADLDHGTGAVVPE